MYVVRQRSIKGGAVVGTAGIHIVRILHIVGAKQIFVVCVDNGFLSAYLSIHLLLVLLW